MRIILKTNVQENFRTVFQSFDLVLFKFLLPPGAELIRFDGSKKGDMVHLKFNFPFKGEWISVITENRETEDESYFIDRGEKLPLGIRTWLHKHIVEENGKFSTIIDDIKYSTGNVLLDLLYFLPLYFAFFPRKFLYKKYFNIK